MAKAGLMEADTNPLPPSYKGYAEEGKGLAVPPSDITFKDAAKFVAEMTPIVGDAIAVKEIYDELRKENPNYYLVGALGGAALIGLVPGLGDAAAKLIKKGAQDLTSLAKRIEVDPNAVGMSGGNISLKPKVNSEVFLETLKKEKNKDDYIYIVHGGDDFKGPLDLKRVGTGEPGDYRPLGIGIYGLTFNPNSAKEALDSLEGAQSYGQHYAGSKSRDATKDWKGYSDPDFKKAFDWDTDYMEGEELLAKVYAKYPTRILQEITYAPKVHLLKIKKDNLKTITPIGRRNTFNDKYAINHYPGTLSDISKLLESGKVKQGPFVDYKDRYIDAYKKKVREGKELPEMPDLSVQRLGSEKYVHNEVAMHNPDIVERVGTFDVSDDPTYEFRQGPLSPVEEIRQTKSGPREIGPQEYLLNPKYKREYPPGHRLSEEKLWKFGVSPYKFTWQDVPQAKEKYEGLGIYRGPEGTFESGRPQTEAMKRAAMNPAEVKRINAEERAARIAAQREEELTARPRKGPVFDLSTGIKNKLPGGRAKGGSIMAQDGMTPLVPNPNIRPPEIKPRSTDDYTPTEVPVDRSMGMFSHPVYNRPNDPVSGKDKLGIIISGVGKDLEKAYDISEQFRNKYKFTDDDSSEDTFRHIILGGLVSGSGDDDPMRKTIFKGMAGSAIDAREGNDPESKIDVINNEFGRKLRTLIPNEQEFLAAVEGIVMVMRQNVPRDMKEKEIQKMYGISELPIMSLTKHASILESDEWNSNHYEYKHTDLVERFGMDPRDASRVLVEDAEEPYIPPTKKQLEEGMNRGGLMTEPMTAAQQAPRGSGPKAAQGRKQTPAKRPKVQKGLAQRQVDPRDVAMREIQQASQQRGAMQAAKGVTAITVGLGAPDLMEAEKGEPPAGATKKEIADDQHVMMSEGELVVPANVVRYHGLGSYEAMRQEALMGLQDMEDAGQIEYVGQEKTSKTNDGGLLEANTGLALGSGPTAASAQFAGLSSSPSTNIAPLSLGRPIMDKDGNIIGYEPNTQPTPVKSPTAGIVAPNVGSYETSVKEDFTKPPEGTGGTTTSAGAGTSGPSDNNMGSYNPMQQIQTPQEQMASFDKMVSGETMANPSTKAAQAFNKDDFDSYINVRQPMSEREGIMGKVGGAVDAAAGYILPFTGYQDKKIRESAADRLANLAFGSKEEYDTLMNIVNMEPIKDNFGGGEDDGALTAKIAEAKNVSFEKNRAAAESFNQEKEDALAKAKAEMNAPVLFKENTFVDNFLEGTQRNEDARKATREALAKINPDSMSPQGSDEQKRIRELDAQRASDVYNQGLKAERDREMDKLMNPVYAAEKMRSELPDASAGQRSGAEQEEEQRRQQDAARRAKAMDEFRDREATRRAEDSTPGRSRGDFGGTPTATENCVIATHGLSTGGFSKLEKAKAEIWCAKTYHGKWYGEAFRRGYRAAGQRCIDSGKAHEHYQEFKDFVAYGRGVKKGFGLGLQYYLRTVQFFITGLFISE